MNPSSAAGVDIDHLRTWIGRQETHADRATLFPVAALSATLDRDDPAPAEGDTLPPLWHWLYFLPTARQSGLGPDGHPARGGFLPPVPLPRRMWAGGRLEFLRPIHLGEKIQRISTIKDVTLKTGRTGPMIFVLVRHEVHGENGLAITEEHDIVYRDAPAPTETPPAPRAAPEAAIWDREITPDDVLLFRYSALTFNGHRIHYDRRYVTETEGYPGLIVHGPLIATLLVDLVRRNVETPVKSFTFRAVKPVFDIGSFRVRGVPSKNGKVALWAQDSEGWTTMEAEALLF